MAGTDRPLIVVTTGRGEGRAGGGDGRVRPARRQVYVVEEIVTLLRGAGAHVVLLPPGDPAVLDAISFDGAVITGGAFDIHPRHYGQAAAHRLDATDDERTALELQLASRCAGAGTPLLGICGGMQALAVALGGTLVQDIATTVPGALEHEQPTDPATPWHPVTLTGPIAGWVGPAVNSTHHQAVADPGPLRVVGRAPDGVVEALELPGHPWCFGVQWHPEWLPGTLFAALVDAARARAEQRRR